MYNYSLREERIRIIFSPKTSYQFHKLIYLQISKRKSLFQSKYSKYEQINYLRGRQTTNLCSSCDILMYTFQLTLELFFFLFNDLIIEEPFHCEIAIQESLKSHGFLFNVLSSKTRLKQLTIIFDDVNNLNQTLHNFVLKSALINHINALRKKIQKSVTFSKCVVTQPTHLPALFT